MFSKGLKEDNVYIATQGNMIIHCTFVNYMPPPQKKRLRTVNVAFHCFLTLFLGPKQNTVADFWCMVWQEHIEQIIMLTNVMEGNTVNNDSYIFVFCFFCLLVFLCDWSQLSPYEAFGKFYFLLTRWVLHYFISYAIKSHLKL